MTPRMPPVDRYSYEKLDSDGNWVFDMPTSVAATGRMFDHQPPTSTTAPPPSTATTAAPQRRNDQYIYPDPSNASRRPTQPYFEKQGQSAGGGRAPHSLPRNLNPDALPFFAPPKRASETLRQETEYKRRASRQTAEVPRVAVDDKKVRPSPAARRASRAASASHVRQHAAHQHLDPRVAAPSNASPRNLKAQIDRSPLAAKPQPVSVPDWTANQTNAYHPGVGQVRARLPKPASQEEEKPIVGTSSELSAWGIDEPFPCTNEDCTSRHQPFTKKGQLTKHMKSHQSNAQFRHRCEVCDHGFRCPRELTRHRKTHNPNLPPEEQFPCPKCPKLFPRDDNLKRHIRQQHPEQPTQFGLVTPPRTAASSSRFDPRDFPPLPPPTAPRSVDR